MLRARFLTAIVFIPIVLLLIRAGGLPWLGAVLVIAALGWREMSTLIERDALIRDRIIGLIFVCAIIIEAFAGSRGLIPFDMLRPLLAAFLVASLISALYSRVEHPTTVWALNVAGALYLGFLLSHIVSLRELARGEMWVLLALSLTWIDDTAAFFVGRMLGRHKMWPRISPKKTWEGLAGGSIAAVVAGPLLGAWLLGLTPLQGLIIGLLVAFFAPFGDLSVSLFKRIAHMKDSSTLIPGHGGILDRLDSLLFTFPAILYFAWCVTRI